MEAFVKDPSAVKDYVWDWTNDLGSDSITTATIEISPSGTMTASTPSVTSTTVTSFLTGGASGIKYSVTCRIVTNGGRTFDKLIRLLVVEE